MCGFIGCFRPAGQPLSRGILPPMLAAIRHRGPDDEGLHGISFHHRDSQPITPGCEAWDKADGGFGFARLSIQDLSAAGHQPMVGAEGRAILVFNGEIYNAAAIRPSGESYRGHSDTEVLLKLYERHGWHGMLERLDGMFAIAIADVSLGLLRVARDPFGIKPLYYTQLADGTLLLASEIKAFLAHPQFQPRLEEAHVAEQLLFRYTAWDRTLLRGVKQLPPGHELIWQAETGDLTLRRYWSLPDAAPGPVNAMALRDTLRAAVQRQLVSDVPLGTQLSGGIDSSLITLDATGDRGVTRHSFSIVFDDPNVSEDVWITQAARAAGVHSHRYLFSPRHFAEDFARVTWHLDGPPGNPNTLALDLLAREARSTVKVLLTGEGCDELFAGYNRFYYSAMQQRHPQVFRAGAALCGQSRGRLWRLFGQATQSLEHQMVTGSAYGAASLISALLPGAQTADALTQRLDHLAGIPGHGITRQIRYEAETYLPDLLLRQDKMTMAHGVECRVPFLDLELVRAARALPESSLAAATYGPNARMRGTKRLIKQLAAAEFGAAFAYRRKRGFDVPLSSFFQQPQVKAQMMEAWLPGIRRRGLLDARAVEKLWQQLQAAGPRASGAQTSAAESLWVAVGMEVWAAQVLDWPKTNNQ